MRVEIDLFQFIGDVHLLVVGDQYKVQLSFVLDHVRYSILGMAHDHQRFLSRSLATTASTVRNGVGYGYHAGNVMVLVRVRGRRERAHIFRVLGDCLLRLLRAFGEIVDSIGRRVHCHRGEWTLRGDQCYLIGTILEK